MRDDPRIPRYFDAIDTSFGVGIDYISQGFAWKPVSDRVQRVGTWIPTTTGNPLPNVFGNGTNGKKGVVVSVMNILHGSNRTSPRASEYRVVVADKSGFWELFPDALPRIAVAVQALYGTADSVACSEQLHRTPEDLAGYPENAGIKGYKTYPLRRSKVSGLDIAGASIEMKLSWLNYWSDAVARALGFPDAERDRPLAGGYQRVADQGWLVALTPEPLDLERPDHLV